MRISRIITGAFSALALLVGMGVTAPAANAEINVYTTPGEHTINGRQWRTWCEPYSRTARCTTQIKVAGVWTFNNLTYLPSPRTLWKGNPLATPGYHTVAGLQHVMLSDICKYFFLRIHPCIHVFTLS